MKNVVVILAVFALFIALSNIVFASSYDKPSLRDRHYMTCMDGAVPRDTMVVAGRYLISSSTVRYVPSCSDKKHEKHRYMVAAYNYGRYMY